MVLKSNSTPTTNLTNNELKNYISNLKGFEKRYGVADENFCVL